MSINGTEFADTLSGTLGDDVIDALGGNDIINGSQGNDSVSGGLGSDRLIFTLADTSLFDAAIAARSYLIGASSVTDSSSLINTSFSSVENITFSTIGAGDYDDVINASGFTGTSLTILLGNGNADVTGSIRADNITTGRGDNVISAGGGSDTINASQGHDTIDGGASGPSGDLLSFSMSSARFDAAAGARTYTFTSNHVGDSSGTVNTDFTSIERFSISTRQAGDFDDIIDGSGIVSSSTSTVFTVYVGNGDNIITGSSGTDFVSLGAGSNWVDTGAGEDSVAVNDFSGLAGAVQISGSGGVVTTQVGGLNLNTILNAEFIRIHASSADGGLITDASGLTGYAGMIAHIAYNGTNNFTGHAGRDFLSNTATFFDSVDTFTGNGGADIYDYTVAVGAMNGDTITDFDADDIIDFQYNDPIYNSGFLAHLFIGNAAFSNVAGQYRYYASGGQTFVEADTNGDGVADETLTIANGQFAMGETSAGSNILQMVGISGTSGDDFLIGSKDSDDVIFGQGGDDTIAGTQGADRVDGGDGWDQLRIQTGFPDRFDAATGPRTYTIAGNWIGDSSGTLDTTFSWVESIFLRTVGNGDYGDTVDASGWNGDSLILRLGNGDDTVIGSAKDDDIGMALGNNSADAGGGYDIVYTAFDNTAGATAYVTSSGGTVHLTVGGVQTASIVNGEEVHITGYFASGVTTVIDASGFVPVAGVTLVLRDSNGDDVIIGSSGSDWLSNVGLNSLGSDTFTGNGGADVFDWTYASDNINGDVITDLDTDDTLDFRFNNGDVAGASPLLCNSFIGMASFSGTAGEYRFQASGGQTQIQVDSDGDGLADQVMTIANGEFGLVETAAGSNVLMRANLLIDNDNEDFLVGDAGNDYIMMLGGNDFTAATRGIDFVDGGADFDQLRFVMSNAGRFTAPTGSRTYTITGSQVTDSSGQLNTSFVNFEQVYLTTINTGDFGDTIDGSATGASLMLRLGGGNDTVIGGAGNDDINTGLGVNTVDAGGGEDLVVGQFDNDLGATAFVTFDGSAVVTTVNGIATNSVSNAELVGIQGSNFNAAVTTVDASGLIGFSGQLVFWDHNGSNISIGSAGSDIFANVHGGEEGNDVYTGNGGADIYDYTWAIGAMNGDTITDFDADDTIDFMYNNATQNGGGLLANQFIGASNFTGVAGQYRYFSSGGQTFVQADTNGDGVADETLTIANGQFALGETFAGSNILQMIGISGTSGADTLTGTLGNDSIYAQGGNDTIFASQGADFIDGGSGVDRVNLSLGNVALFGAASGPRTYTLTSTGLTDSSGVLATSITGIERITMSTVSTGDFGDTIDASGFVLASPTGALVLNLTTGGGADTVTGTDYRDFIQTGLGDDVVNGGGGDDFLFVGLGTNTVDGGVGVDEVSFIFANNSSDTLYLTQAGATITATLGGVVINTISNAEFLSAIYADENAAETRVDASGIAAGALALLVFRDHNGSDILVGSHGADFFSNGTNYTAGNDVYTGNGGADIFDYTFAVNGMDGDTITDFDADDVIDFMYNNATQNGGGLLANQFIGAAAFTGVAGQYRYYASGGQTFVQADTNGDGVADETLTIANGQFALGETFAGSNILQIIGISGTSGADTLTGTLGNDSIYAQAGNDIINGSQGTDFIDGGNGGGDRLFMNTGTASLFTAATGARTYTIGANSITDSSGTVNTTFTAVERIAFSTVGNGDFDDVIDASGFVSAHGSPLDIRLGDGDNQVLGSSGNDRMFTGFGSNILDGGSGGYDHGFINADASSAVSITIANVGGTLVTSADGVVNQITNFDEVWVQGVGTGAVTLDASGYTDIAGLLLVLVGHNGTDIMIGSAGNDFFANITGQVLGSDVYTGNGGADIYDYTWAADSMYGDVITDFDIDDVVDFRFNNLEAGGSPVLANHFIGANAFSGTAGEYRYQISGTRTIIQIDSNGDGLADQVDANGDGIIDPVLTITNGAFALAETYAGSNILTLASVIRLAAGTVADGYLAGATLFIDTDGDKVLDDGEAWTTTDANGDFTLNVNQGGTLVAVGGTNIDTGIANSMTLVAPEESGMVNPLTTLIQAVIDADEGGTTTAAQAQATVLAALGLDPALDLLNLDLIAAAATDPAALEAQKAAAMIANLVAAVDGAESADAGSEGLLVEALADLVTNGGGEIDLTDANTLTPLLSEALPGTDVTEIAEEAAVEGEAIASATSIDEISDAQYNAQTFNHIAGGNGSDTLTGTDGRDLIVGGDGKDFLRGGGGDDLFIAEFPQSKITTKLGSMSVDVIFDFASGDQIDVSGLDANWLKTGDQAFNWKGSNANKAAGDLSYKSYASVHGAEKALGIDIDGVAGPSPYSGPVTVVFGNVDGGTPDFALVLIGTPSVNPGDFIFA